MYSFPSTPSEKEKSNRDLDKLFDFDEGQPKLDHQEQDQKDVDSYESFSYDSGRHDDRPAVLMPLARLQPQAGYGQNMAGLPIVRSQVQPGHPVAVQAPAQPPANPFAASLGHAHVLNQPFSYALGNLHPAALQAPQAVVPNPMAHGLPAPVPPPAVNVQPPPGAGPNYLRLNHEHRPPRNVQWPMNTPISLIEICTFCPDWFKNPEAISRAIRNEWTREDLAKAQLLAEDPLTRHLWRNRSERIQKQISAGGKMIDNAGQGVRFNSEDFRTRHGAQNDLTANAWQFRHVYDATWGPENSGHMPLSELYAAVVNWSGGNDRLQMTRCLEFARANPQLDLDTSPWVGLSSRRASRLRFLISWLLLRAGSIVMSMRARGSTSCPTPDKLLCMLVI